VIKENSMTVDGLGWFYRTAEPLQPSSKPPVLLLHDLPSQSYSWREVMPALAEQGFQTIAPDWLGFGFSDLPDRRDFAYTAEAYSKALAALLQALEIDRIHLVVQGFMGTIGLQYALQHPDQIDRLAILNTPLTSAAKLPWKIKQFGVPLMGDMMTQDPLLVDRTLEGGGGYQIEDADLDVYRRPFLRSSAAGRSLMAVVQNLKLPQATARIESGFTNWQSPILVAWGVRDPWLSLEMAEAFVKTLPEGKLMQLEAVGHYPQEDWHEKVSEALLIFLRQQAL
jgi:pimeloyl-ACP methyl ester carboxylesterase